MLFTTLATWKRPIIPVFGVLISLSVEVAAERQGPDFTRAQAAEHLTEHHMKGLHSRGNRDFIVTNPLATDGSLANHEVALPYTASHDTPHAELYLAELYLNNPSSVGYASALALYHLKKGRLRGRHTSGDTVAHNIYALYFLNRLRDLGSPGKWIDNDIRRVERRLDTIAPPGHPPVIEERRDSHQAFIHAFNYDESSRYAARDALLDDYVEQPENVVTNAYLAASNIWVGGEAPYDDPAILYHFILSSYFSVKAVKMAQDLELVWLQDPENNERFRLAPILGGWVVPARRWLATLHGDEVAVSNLDEEHRHWMRHHPAFHSVSIGLMLFDEDEMFWEGFGAWIEGLILCERQFEYRACDDRPKFSFNRISFLLGAIDYFVKAGDLDSAQAFTQYRWAPFFHFDKWSIGSEEWMLRENNLLEFYDLYNNGDPTDDPTHFLSKSHKWGPDTIACQACHNTQNREWSQEDIDYYELEQPLESIATFYEWPALTTTWYGGSQ